MTNFDLATFNVAKFDELLTRGLSHGLGEPNGQMCIEAAICATLGLDHGDDPKCVSEAVRRFKIALNDKKWSSPQARARGLRDLGLAQLGSLGVVKDDEFLGRLSEKLIRVLVPQLFREVFPGNQACLDAATRCELEGTKESAKAATNAAAAATAYAAKAAANAAAKDTYLVLTAQLVLEVLRELKSPGVSLLTRDT